MVTMGFGSDAVRQKSYQLSKGSPNQLKPQSAHASSAVARAIRSSASLYTYREPPMSMGDKR